MPKKLKPIKAEKFDDEEEVKDDYYEDEFKQDEVVEDLPKNFEAVEDPEEEKYEDAKRTFRRANSDKIMRIFNIFFVISIIIILIIGIDVICVSKYNVGPFFAIKTTTYKDGGTTEHYGLGYKVIKYKELSGRQDTQVGFWNLKYNTTPTYIEDIDIAIAFQNNPEETADKYYKNYISITSTIKEIDTKNNKIIMEYKDPDGKYTLNIVCDMNDKIDENITYKIGDKLVVKGTVYKFTIKEKESANSIYLMNCFMDIKNTLK